MAQELSKEVGAQRRHRRGHWFLAALIPIVLDVGVPLVIYYGLHALGQSNVVALLAGGAVPLLRALWNLARRQRVDTLTLLMIILFAGGAALTLVSGNARFLVAKESIATGAGGLWIIWSAFTTQPLTYSTTRPFVTRGEWPALAIWDRLSYRPGRFRRILRGLALMWGIALVIDCVLRLIVALTMPVSTAVGFSAMITIGVIVFFGLVSTIAGGVMRAVIDAELAVDAKAATRAPMAQ